MIEFLTEWYRRHFSDPQAVLLAMFLMLGTLALWLAGRILMPLLVALVLAYLLEGPVGGIMRRVPLRRLPAVCVIFSLFILFLILVVLGLFPVLSREFSDFLHNLPKMIGDGQELLLRLPEQYPNIVSTDTVSALIDTMRQEITALGQDVLSLSVASIPVIIAVLVYLILVPLMIFFLLADKDQISRWCGRFLPAERALINQVWEEMDAQIGNYVRGKFFEIIIVGGFAHAIFVLLGLNYSPLLSILVGLSVLIPYIGAAVVTLPIALVGYAQWGFGTDFYWLLGGYFVLQFLDGNVLVPILFSEAVNLHPIAIIVAILLFGGMWGFWGVFFAIPLATLVKAVLNAWPDQPKQPVAPCPPPVQG